MFFMAAARLRSKPSAEVLSLPTLPGDCATRSARLETLLSRPGPKPGPRAASADAREKSAWAGASGRQLYTASARTSRESSESGMRQRATSQSSSASYTHGVGVEGGA